MFKMIGRKTLKRITRFGLCFYVFSYCMAFTVCAESFPSLEAGPEAAVITEAVSETGIQSKALTGESDTAEADPVSEEVQPVEETSGEPEMLGGSSRYDRNIKYTGNTVTGLFDELWIIGDDSFSAMVNLTQDLVLTNQSLINQVKRSGDVLIDGKGYSIVGNRIAHDNLNQSSLDDYTWFRYLTFENTVFKDFDGSVIHDNHLILNHPISQELTFRNCTFIDNSGSQGGAVFINDTSLVRFVNCTFINNTAANGGVAYVDDQGSLIAEDCRFINNSATGGNGGAIFVAGDGGLTVTNSSFTGNTISSGKKGSAIWCNASSGSVGGSGGGNIFLKNSGDPVVFFGNKGSYEMGECWFGHTEKDCSKAPAVEGYDLKTWRFINLTRNVGWNTSIYSLYLDTTNGYNATIENGSARGVVYIGEWNLPDLVLEVSAVNATLLNDTIVVRSGENSYAAGSWYRSKDDQSGMAFISGAPKARWSAAIPELGYTQTFNRTLSVYQLSGYPGTGKDGDQVVAAFNDTMEKIWVDGDDTAVTVDNKTMKVSFAGKTYEYPIGGEDLYTVHFNMTLNDSIRPGLYNATYEVEGFLPLTKTLNVTKFVQPTSFDFLNATAVDEGETDWDKIYLKNMADIEFGKGFNLRMKLISPRTVDRGKMYILNGSDNINETSRILNMSAVAENKSYIDLNLSVLRPGSYSLIAVYEDVSEDEYGKTFASCNTSYHPLNFTVTGDAPEYDDAGVSFPDGASLEKALSIGNFTLNVSAANPGAGVGIWSFESSNESVATVDNEGLVTLKAVGVTNITASYKSLTSRGKAVLELMVVSDGAGGDPANVFPVPINGSVVQNQTVSLGTGGAGEEISLEIWYTSNVSFIGSKFKAKDIEDLGNGSYSVGGVIVKLNSSLEEVAKPIFKFKNTKHASANPKSKKPACFIISFKVNKGVSKENKTAVKNANKVLKKNPVEFTIEQADFSQATEGNVYMNGKKTKVKKAEVTISGNKLYPSKKDYDATVTEKDATLTGKGDYKGNITLPLPG